MLRTGIARTVAFPCSVILLAILIAFLEDDRAFSAEPQQTYVAPFHVKEKDWPIVLKAEINGRECALMVDTGASQTLLDARLKSLLGDYQGMGAIRVGDTTVVARAHESSVIRLAGCRLQSAVSVACVDIQRDLEELAAFQVDGILGMDYLHDWIIGIDFDNFQLSLTDSLPDEKSLGQRLPLTIQHRRPHVLCTIGSHEVPCLVDTGCVGFLVANSSTFNTLSPQHAKRRSAHCADFALGEFQHEEILVHKSGRELNLLGLHCLSQYRVTLDLKGKSMYLSPGKAFGERDTGACDGVTLDYIELGGKSGVGLIALADHLAGAQGIKTGDMLLEIGGQDARKMELAEIRRLWSGRGAAELTLRVRRDAFDADLANDEEFTTVLPPRPNRKAAGRM